MRRIALLLTIVFLSDGRLCASEGAGDQVCVRREWTSLDGRKLTAEFLGTKGDAVVIRLVGGKIMEVPRLKFSAEDNEYLREHGFEYHAAWREWPMESRMAARYPDVEEEVSENGEFVYTTPHFRFRSDADLGRSLMNDISRVFELTYQLHEYSPFGILAKPGGDRFRARLFRSVSDYHEAGGPAQTAGAYLLLEKLFLARLDLMGVREGSAGWRKVTDSYDPSTIIHELTHMLTHDMLENLPTWANEGYAEYISNIPIEGRAFRSDAEDIRQGVRDRFIRDYVSSHTRPGMGRAEFSAVDKAKYLRTQTISLEKVADVLRMTDLEWATGVKPGEAGLGGPRVVRPPRLDGNRLPRLYRTAHLIFYYFIQIEGEEGVTKIRRFIENNRRHMARYLEYENAFRTFQKEIEAFMKLPGVSKLADGRVEYPADLRVPVAPEAPFTDPNVVKMGGLDALLGGESAAVVGDRIEDALVKDLGLKLRFGEEDGVGIRRF